MHLSKTKIATFAMMATLFASPGFAADTSDSAAADTSASDSSAPPALVPMIVDADAVLAASKAGKSILNQLKAKNRENQAALEKRQDKLMAEKQELAKQQGTVPEAQFEQKVAAFDQEVQALNNDAQNKGHGLELAKEDALGKVNREFGKIVQQIALKRHANIVFNGSQLVVYDQAYDVSRDVLAQLDATLPDVKVVIPKDTGDASGDDQSSNQDQGQ